MSQPKYREVSPGQFLLLCCELLTAAIYPIHLEIQFPEMCTRICCSCSTAVSGCHVIRQGASFDTRAQNQVFKVLIVTDPVCHLECLVIADLPLTNAGRRAMANHALSVRT